MVCNCQLFDRKFYFQIPIIQKSTFWRCVIEDVVKEILNSQNTTNEKLAYKVCEISYLQNVS